MESGPTEKTIGSYKLSTDSTIGISELKLTVNAGEGIKYYSIMDTEGSSLYSREPIGIDSSFSYLSILSKNVSALEIKLYDENKKLKYNAKLDQETQSIVIEVQ